MKMLKPCLSISSMKTVHNQKHFQLNHINEEKKVYVPFTIRMFNFAILSLLYCQAKNFRHELPTI